MPVPNNSNASSPNVDSFVHHPKYYIEGADLHVIVGEVLFRVHGYFFTRESKTFHDKVYPAGPGVTRQGASDREPLRLSNVTFEEFETFLFVFYNPRYSVYENTVDHWKVILKLAQEWNFDEVKELAVRELHKKKELSIAERIALYQNHKVNPRHLIPLYSIFCERDYPLTASECEMLGYRTTALIAAMRERLRVQPSDTGRSPLPRTIEREDIYRSFEAELEIGMGSTTKFQQEFGFSPIQISSPSSAQHTERNVKQNETRDRAGKGGRGKNS